MSVAWRTNRTRGASASGVFALIVAGVLLLALGFVVGRKAGSSAGPGPAVSRPAGTDDQGPKQGQETPATTDETASTQDGSGGDGAEGGTVRALATESDPWCVFDPPELAFGHILPGTELSQTVKITNVGTRPLTVKSMTPSCACTTMEDLTGAVIEPGGSVEFTPLVEARSWMGMKRDRVTFLFEEVNKPYIMNISSNVGRAVVIEPAYITAVPDADEHWQIRGETPEATQERLTGEFTVRSIDDRPFRILAVNGEEPPYVDFDPETDEIRSEYKLTWDLSVYDESACVDEFGNRMPGWWVVETDHPDAPVLDARVRHLCTMQEPYGGRMWGLTDFRVVLGEIKAGRPVEFTTSMKWLRDQPPTDTIRAVKSESTEFEADLVEVGREGETITALVRIVPSPDHRGLLYGTCRFFSYTPGHSAPLTVIARVVE